MARREGQRLVRVPDNFFEVLTNFKKKYQYIWRHMADAIGVASTYFYTVKRDCQIAMAEDIFDAVNKMLLEHHEMPFKKQYYGKGNNSSIAVSQRPGDAHMCINGMLLCGETDLSVRYYRAHEEWLNQAEICPDCLKAFKEAEKLWKNNQEPSKVQPKVQPKEPKREKGIPFGKQVPEPPKVHLLTPYGNLEIPQGTKVHIEHQVGGDIHIDIWPEEDNR